MAADQQQSDLDATDFYSFGLLPAPYTLGDSYTQDLLNSPNPVMGTRWTRSFNQVTQLASYNFSGASDDVKNLAAAVVVSLQNTQKYVDNSVAAFSSDLVPIQSLLNTYLPRIDTNTENLHGDLLNIQSALGWTAGGNTVLYYLDSLRSNLLLLRSDIWSLSSAVETGFSDVITRQDTMYNFWDNANWQAYYASDGVFFNSRGSLSSVLANVTRSLLYTGFTPSGLVYLASDGTSVSTGDGGVWLPAIVRYGLLGLSVNLAGTDKTASASFWSGPQSTQSLSATNILDMLGLIGTQLQNPLAKLQYVWADDDDIRIADANKPVKDEIEQDFVGGGDAAVRVSDISSMADVGSDLRDLYSGAGSMSDAFSSLADGGNFIFFSSDVAAALDTVNAPATQSDDDPMSAWLSQYYFDEDGIAHLKDKSLWDLDAYLESLK